MGTSSLFDVSFSSGIKTITMKDTRSRNALSLNMQKELYKYITADWDDKKLRAIVLQAEGPAFSSGHNLKEFNFDTNDKSLLEEVFKMATKLMLSITECPVPVIACVNGIAAAAGCQLAAQCDIVVASDKSLFSTPGVSVGVFCSSPGIPISRTIPRKLATYMLTTGLPITATEAKSAGLVSVVCPEDQLKGQVEKICAAITAKSRYVVTKGKRFYYRQIDMTMKEAYKIGELEMIERISESEGQEGLKSFIEKRKPNWKHSV
ncbi:hypothetical protein RN001_014081 [Aquatica leii]|uniref:Enoyl-CoA hydratase domain-containing protein 3, mitochondrial n=1 Tax=Aquatica leii TaxID=1421715 RepID=A0AAN7P3Q5_9COLE|nr:hypothetical protein RN001_014081 [Aquatica leii]